MKNILVRSLSGAVFVGLILIPLFVHSSILLYGVYFTLLFLSLVEYNRLFSDHPFISIDWRLNTFFSLSISLLIYISLLRLSLLFFLVSICLFFIWILLELWRKKEHPLLNISLSLFGFIYISIPFLLIMLSVHHSVLAPLSEQAPFPFLAGMFFLIWTNDTFAFLCGRLLGKTPLFKRISPNKTWEGTLGGAFIASMLGCLFGLFFLNGQFFFFWSIASILIILGSIFGDLLESMFKRSLNKKDSGTLIPGHGGLLDRLDATLFTVPFFMLWLVYYTHYLL